MALPKKVKKNLDITSRKVQEEYPFGYNGIQVPDRRKELAGLITEDGTFLPKSVLHEDLDGGMLSFVQEQLKVALNGKQLPVIDRILTIQRWGEFAQTWSFANEDKNVELPFIVVVRKPDVQYGSNPALRYTIPNRKQFHFAKVPTWDGTRKGMDVYTIPQPVPIDITYDVKIVCNRMRELNIFNRKVMQTFTSRQAYTFVKGHYVPIILNSVGDESVIDTDDRRYYQQNYSFILLGFLIDEEEFEVKPAITRNLMLFDFDVKNKRKNIQVMDGKVNPYKYRRKLNYEIGSTTPEVGTITYQYRANIKTVRTRNVSSVTFKINGVTDNSPEIEIKKLDKLEVIIDIDDNSKTSMVVLEETLLP
tara:strand:- start:270 stop:1358 length:1089 start_codon:yes stop_codon:yes gene_type:complete